MKNIIDHIPSTEFGTEQIGDQSYKFKFVLFNKDNQHLVLRRGALDNLVLYDDILRFYHYGYADIRDPHNVLYKTDVIKDVLGESHASCFKLRNDQNLFIYLFIEPNIKDTLTTDDLHNEMISMEFVFNVTKAYTVPDPSGNPDLQIMRMEFEDYRQSSLQMQLSDYSTKALYDKQIAGVDNPDLTEKNEIYTGDAIKDLLAYSLGPATKFSGIFDKGAYKTSYTSPGGSTYAFDLDTLLNRHISIKEKLMCPCFLKANRFALDQEFSLTPIYDIYNNAYNHNTKTAGLYMSEKFIIAEADISSDATKDTTAGRELFSQLDESSYHFPDYSIINNYAFTDIQNITNATLYKPREAHNYDSQTKTFNISYIDQKMFDDEYKEQISGPVVGSNQPAYNVYDYTNLNRIIDYSTTNTKEKAAAYAKNNKLLETIFNGNQIDFIVKGGTWRRSMRMFSVENAARGPGSEFSAKANGQYLSLKVTHEINANGYTNTIKGTTPNNLDELGQSSGLGGYRVV